MLTIPKPLPVKQMNKLNTAELQIPHFSEGYFVASTGNLSWPNVLRTWHYYTKN